LSALPEIVADDAVLQLVSVLSPAGAFVCANDGATANNAAKAAAMS
jgi:hypothetical protein